MGRDKRKRLKERQKERKERQEWHDEERRKQKEFWKKKYYPQFNSSELAYSRLFLL